jgi:uncharacterized protein YjbI with pentapeptide repeats
MMCDWKPEFDLGDYTCPYENYKKSKDKTKGLCILHNNREDKDPEKFYQEIKNIYESKKHNFRGFIFPKNFSFMRLKEDLKIDHLVFTDANFSEAIFFCNVNLSGAEFNGEGGTDFHRATFSGQGRTDFHGAIFSNKGGTSFIMANFSGQDSTWFLGAQFSGQGKIDFRGATFSDNGVLFTGAHFFGEGITTFSGATFSVKGETNFSAAQFASRGGTFFAGVQFFGKGMTNFMNTKFSSEGGTDFGLAQFAGEGQTNFAEAQFSGNGVADFGGARFFSQRGTLFSGRTFQNIILASFRRVNFKNPKRVTFDGVDLSHVWFLDTDLSKINFTKVFWCGRKYNSRFYIGRNKVFDELFQERGWFIRYLQKLFSKMGFTKIPLHVVKQLGQRIPKDDKGIVCKYIQSKYNDLLTYAQVTATEKKEDHYDVYRLYNQLLQNYEASNRYHEAGDFFAGMMEMRRRESFEKPRTRIALWFYRIFSLYGERPNLAIAWLAILWLISGLVFLDIGLTPVNTYNNNHDKYNIVVPKGQENNLSTEVQMNTLNPKTYASGEFKDNYLKSLNVSLNHLTIGKVDSPYKLRYVRYGFLLQGLETILGAVFISLFVLAMNRKFRRTKD